MRFGLALVQATGAHPSRQTGPAVLLPVPVVHRRQGRVALVDGQHRSFGEHVQLAVGNDGRDFDDAVGLGVQAGHFQVDPNQVVGDMVSLGYEGKEEKNQFNRIPAVVRRQPAHGAS